MLTCPVTEGTNKSSTSTTSHPSPPPVSSGKWIRKDSVCHLFKPGIGKLPCMMRRLFLWPTYLQNIHTLQEKSMTCNCVAVAPRYVEFWLYINMFPAWPQWADVSTCCWVWDWGGLEGWWQQLRKPQVAGQCAVFTSSPIWRCWAHCRK